MNDDDPQQSSSSVSEPDDSATAASSDQFAASDNAAANSCSETPVTAPTQSCGLPDGFLAVKVTDYYDQPVRHAEVSVDGLGDLTTDDNGIADYGKVRPGSYNVIVKKEGYRPEPNTPVGPVSGSGEVSSGQSTVVPLRLDVFRENVIFLGSEMDYDSFWLKMMFVASAWVEALNHGLFRSADRKTVAYVGNGYSDFEKWMIVILHDNLGFKLVELSSGSDIVKLINDRLKPNVEGVKEMYLLQDVAFFSHGLPGAIKLNYNSSPKVDFTDSEIASSDVDTFAPDGRIYSYACRTGVGSWQESFSNDDEARPQDSLAQYMADHFKVETHAFLRRSFYGEVLREKKDSSMIAKTLKTARETREGDVIEIPLEHQALPHPGLDTGWFAGSKAEGTNEYALWRKAGGIRLPRSAESPSGLSEGMRVFTPA